MTITAEPDTDALWKLWRLAGITASDVAAAASGYYGGAYGVVATKLGLLPPVVQTEQMARGHRWQPLVAAATPPLTGLYVVGAETWCQHPDQPRHRATVDGFLAATPEATANQLAGVHECKSRDVNVRPPRHYWRAQVQWQLWVTGLPFAHLVEVVVNDADDSFVSLHLERVDADRWEQEALVSVADQLAQWIDTATLPDPDGGALDLVKQVTAVADPDAVTVDLTDLADLVRRYDDLKTAAAAIKAEQDDIQATVRARLGAATRGTTDAGWSVSVSKPTNVVDEQAALAAHPDYRRTAFDRTRFETELGRKALDEFRTPTGARKFTITPPKENRS